MNPIRVAGPFLFAALALALPAHAQTLYRYVDPSGHVVYSDQPPPPDAKGVQSKQLQGNVIDTDATPLATRQAMQAFPVTLYTFDCGDVCREAQALLARRGVPHATVDVTTPEGGTKLKSLTGGQSAPVLQVGDKRLAVGYNEARWQALLDEAGYPKDAPPLRAGPGAATASTPGGPAPAAPAAKPSAPGAAAAAPPAAPAKGTGYPQ
jgi:glutaredoxin